MVRNLISLLNRLKSWHCLGEDFSRTNIICRWTSSVRETPNINFRPCLCCFLVCHRHEYHNQGGKLSYRRSHRMCRIRLQRTTSVYTPCTRFHETLWKACSVPPSKEYGGAGVGPCGGSAGANIVSGLTLHPSTDNVAQTAIDTQALILAVSAPWEMEERSWNKPQERASRLQVVWSVRKASCVAQYLCHTLFNDLLSIGIGRSIVNAPWSLQTKNKRDSSPSCTTRIVTNSCSYVIYAWHTASWGQVS